jgi:hypothetical protein
MAVRFATPVYNMAVILVHTMATRRRFKRADLRTGARRPENWPLPARGRESAGPRRPLVMP